MIGFYSGSTPLGMYQKLIEYHREGRISFKYVKTFNMDEYVGLPRDHSESYHYFMWNNFFKHIDILPQNVHILDGNAPNLLNKCEDYERKIKEAVGVHLFIGGLHFLFYFYINCSLIYMKTINFVGSPLLSLHHFILQESALMDKLHLMNLVPL